MFLSLRSIVNALFLSSIVVLVGCGGGEPDPRLSSKALEDPKDALSIAASPNHDFEPLARVDITRVSGEVNWDLIENIFNYHLEVNILVIAETGITLCDSPGFMLKVIASNQLIGDRLVALNTFDDCANSMMIVTKHIYFALSEPSARLDVAAYAPDESGIVYDSNVSLVYWANPASPNSAVSPLEQGEHAFGGVQ